LSYDALSDGVTPDELLEKVLEAVPAPGAGRLIVEPDDELRAGIVRPA
jgi:hypothetical protein